MMVRYYDYEYEYELFEVVSGGKCVVECQVDGGEGGCGWRVEVERSSNLQIIKESVLFMARISSSHCKALQRRQTCRELGNLNE